MHWDNLRECSQQGYLRDDSRGDEGTNEKRTVGDDHLHVALVKGRGMLAAGDLVELGMLPPTGRRLLFPLGGWRRRRRAGSPRSHWSSTLCGAGELAHGGRLLGCRGGVYDVTDGQIAAVEGRWGRAVV